MSSHMFSGKGWWFPILQTFFKGKLSIRHDVAFGIRVGKSSIGLHNQWFMVEVPCSFSKFLITPFWGTLFFPFHVSNWFFHHLHLLQLLPLRYCFRCLLPPKRPCNSPTGRASEAAKMYGMMMGGISWKQSISTPNTLQETKPYAETGDFIATSLTLVGWLSHPPKQRGF